VVDEVDGICLGVASVDFEGADSGAESFKDSVGAKSLKARVFGAGQILTYSAKIANLPMSLKLKYVHEFGAKRRFESKILWGTVGGRSNGCFRCRDPVFWEERRCCHVVLEQPHSGRQRRSGRPIPRHSASGWAHRSLIRYCRLSSDQFDESPGECRGTQIGEPCSLVAQPCNRLKGGSP
jgi:hypothetical protein